MRLRTMFLILFLLVPCGCAPMFQGESIVTDAEPEVDVSQAEAETVEPGKEIAPLSTEITVEPETDPAEEPFSTDESTEETKASDTLLMGSETPGICSPERALAEMDAGMEDSEASDEATPAPSSEIQKVIDEALDFCRVSQELWQEGELEGAIEALDHAYELILKVDTEDIPKLTQQIDDLRFMISKRILEIYASRNIVVNGNHNEIPIVMNEHVQRAIDRFTTGGERNFFVRAYQTSGKYRWKIVEELKKAGLPEELSWLPLIESGFKVNALSRARALGLWQFIPSTGYKFGLKRDRYTDERLDPDKATKAAIAYLKELHRIFGDWSTVLAAYNCGEGRVLQVIRNQNVNYLDNFWDLYDRLPRETARYVPRFLATLHIVKNLEKYGMDDISPCPPLEHEEVTVSRKAHLREIADVIGTSEKALVELNPELRHRIIPDEPYALKVPPDCGETLLAGIHSLPERSTKAAVAKSDGPSGRTRVIHHRVSRGETLSTIAARYGTTTSRLARANGISTKSYIIIGQKLKVPAKGSAVKVKHQSPKHKRAVRHVVKSGDSLWIIARKYGTTTKRIRQENNLSGTRLFIGQVLRIPSASKGSKGDRLRAYRVKSGDIPFDIAKRYNMSLTRFLKVNHLTEASKIYPGQKLYVE